MRRGRLSREPRHAAVPTLLLHHRLAAPAVAVLVAAAAVALGVLLPTATVLMWMEEEGPVEAATLMLYFLAALAVCGDRERLRPPTWLALAVLLAASAAREMDWHKAFTGVSIMKLGYFLGPAPWPQKLLALAALLPIALAGGYLVVRYAAPLWRGARSRLAPAATVLTLLLVLGLCKLADRSLGMLSEDFGVRSSARSRAVQLSLEELLEAALPVLVVLALVQARAGRPQPQPQPQRPSAAAAAAPRSFMTAADR